MMPADASASPEQVARAVGAGVCRLVAGRLSAAEEQRQLDELASLYAEQTDVRHPFSPRDTPVLRTRAQLRAHFAGGGRPPAPPERFEQVDVVVHETDDPEVVVVEFSYAITRAGRDYSVPGIFVMRVRHGEIVESRDYLHHVEMARAMGRLGELTTALAATALTRRTESAPE